MVIIRPWTNGVAAVPIAAVLEQAKEEGAVFGPEDLAAITAAFEATLKRLKVDDRKAAMAFLIAKTTLQIAKDGERDPERLCERVIRAMRKSDPFVSR